MTSSDLQIAGEPGNQHLPRIAADGTRYFVVSQSGETGVVKVRAHIVSRVLTIRKLGKSHLVAFHQKSQPIRIFVVLAGIIMDERPIPDIRLNLPG